MFNKTINSGGLFKMKKLLITLALLLAVAPLAHADNRADLATCQYGVVLAQQAYLTGTFDAKYPDIPHLEYLVDYWGDESGLNVDRKVGVRAVRSIAKFMQKTGVRRPTEQHLYEPVRQALFSECGRYLEIDKNEQR
jgi:hypothetical protein